MFSLDKMPTQEGRIAIVTGANAGLGYETALGLIKKGAHVILACRNFEKAEEAQKTLKEKVPSASLEIILLDLASQQSIKEFADKVNAKFDRLDLLINNAGIMMPPYRETKEGHESQWGVNYLGHFYLTGLLYPLIEKTQDSRIVTLSSLAHENGKIYFDNPNQKESYKPMESYRQSKLACLIFAYELQRRLTAAGSSTKSLAAHPGVALTNLLASGPWWIKLLSPFFSWMLHSVKDGAEPSLLAALDPSLIGGEYIGPTGNRGMKGEPGIVESNKISKDKVAAERLWALSEKQLGFEFTV